MHGVARNEWPQRTSVISMGICKGALYSRDFQLLGTGFVLLATSLASLAGKSEGASCSKLGRAHVIACSGWCLIVFYMLFGAVSCVYI